MVAFEIQVLVEAVDVFGLWESVWHVVDMVEGVLETQVWVATVEVLGTLFTAV